MRREVAAALLAAAIGLAAGCSATSAATSPPAGTAEPSRVSGIAEACAGAQKVINEMTAKFTAEVADAVAAGDRGDTEAQKATMKKIRATYGDWSAALREKAGGTGDPRLKAMLLDYAGAVDATIARVRTAADLELLGNFDDRELDIMANRFHDVCG